MKAGLYEVTGALAFRGHKTGERFEAVLEPRAEQRAIARRNIRLIRRITPSLQPGSYRLPSGWVNQHKEGSNNGQAHRAQGLHRG